MASEEHCPTRLLSDTPAESDAFGGHERIARSIGEVVLNEDGGRAIGLEGGWGAGKSTIVKLTSNFLSQTKGRAFRVAVFDMWAHQDDPLRRTFLENLIGHVQEFGWVNREKWNRRLDELAKRRHEEKTSETPRLTLTGLCFVFTLLSIPVGAALVSAGATLLASEDASNGRVSAFLGTGIIGVLLPLIFYGIVSVIRLRTKNTEGGLSEFPALVIGQAATESRTEVTQTPDPTSVEFESVFGELLDDALGGKERTLLLVVDNLDRVNPSDALSIWSTLQTFLGHSDYRQADWIDHLWVLIPYDGSAILRLWDRSSADANYVQPNGNIVAESTMAASFLDKTFQLRFTVPPLLISNWRDFLRDALKEALPNHGEEDFHGVYRAFALKRGLDTSAPTPRDLKIFVNQIGALHREWQDDFPLSHLACYALLLKDQEDVRSALLSPEEMKVPSRIIGEDWRETIAAFHFGVPSHEARQLLLRTPIESALTSGDGAALAELAMSHPAGFLTVLEDSVPAGAPDWNALPSADLARGAIALADSGVLGHTEDRPEAATIRSDVKTAALALAEWIPFDDETARGMAAIVQLVGDPEETVPSLLTRVSKTAVDLDSPGEWMGSVFTLIEGLVELGLEKHVETGVDVPLNTDQWINASELMADRDAEGRLLHYCSLDVASEIDQQLSQRLDNNQFDAMTFNALDAAMATKSRSNMATVANSVLEHLQTGEQFQGDPLLSMLRTLRSSKEAGLVTEDQYKGFAEDSYYLHHLYSAFEGDHPEAAAACMFGFLQAVPNAQEPNPFGNSSPGYEILAQILQTPNTLPGTVEHFTTLAEENQQLQTVIEIATEQQPIPTFIAGVLRTLLGSTDVCKPPELIKDNWRIVRDILEGESESEDSQSFKAFLQGLHGLGDLVGGIVDDPFDVNAASLYVALLRIEVDTEFETWCAAGVSAVNREVWLNEVMSQGELVELVIELKARKVDVSLTTPYLDALRDYAASVSEGLGTVLSEDSWSELVNLLDAGQQELFPSRIYQVLEESNGEAGADFFELFGNTLADVDLLAMEPRFMDRVCRPIIEADNAAGIEWLATIAEALPAWLSRNNDQAPAFDDFKNRVRLRISDAPEEDPRLHDLGEIGGAIGIERIVSEDA